MKSMTMMRTLEMATLNFFPTEGNWVSSCFKRPNDLNMHNLPCHLRDDAWLASMLMKDQELDYIEYNEVLNFIKTNNFFNDKRHEYEQKIVEWQINWMINGGENWLADLEYGGDLVFLSSSCDIGFRKGIVDTLTKIGIDSNAIEEGIEKYAYIWRNRLMDLAFKNEYNPRFMNQWLLDESVVFPEVDPDFKESWLKLRKHEYYLDHKASVDKYGSIEPGMVLTEDEELELKYYLNQKKKERIEQLKTYEKEIQRLSILPNKTKKRSLLHEIY